MHTTCTRLLVSDMKKPERPRARIFFTRCPSRRRLLRRRRNTAFGPVKNRSTHAAEQAWDMTVAKAAPRTPQFRPKINSGSSIRFSTAPSTTVIMPVRAKPWVLIKGFMPRLIITKRVPQR